MTTTQTEAGDTTVSDPSKILVVLEQTLGHVTHSRNLQRLLPAVDGVDATFAEVEFDLSGRAAKIPGYSNWTVRAGLRARRAVRQHRKRSEPDAMIVHTQVPAVLLGRALASIPTVVSLDATPKQYDELGEHYAHSSGPAPLERIKDWLNRRCFLRAAHIVTWADWTKNGLVDSYGVDPDNVTVIPPGVDVELWSADVDARSDEVVRILFVGGDLERKGGFDLLEAFTALRQQFGDSVELDLVTTADVTPPDGVTVHSTLTSNSPELIALYHQCHIFCLPTRGDCLPMVLAEAGASGLAVVSTDVGAISDLVRNEETGLLVPVSDVSALAAALNRLIGDAELRRRFAVAMKELVATEHDAASNAERLARVAQSVSRSRHHQ